MLKKDEEFLKLTSLPIFCQVLGLASDNRVGNVSSIGPGKMFTDQFKSCMEFRI